MFLTIDWMNGWANDPIIEIHTDVLPEGYTYERNMGCYFGTIDGSDFVDYFYYERPGNGYGGAKFDLNMKDGTVHTLIGPWSSRASVMNSMGFPHCTEVVIILPNENRYSGAMLVPRVEELLVESGIPARLEFNYSDQSYCLAETESVTDEY
jgi:hypothetical protein